MSTSTVLICKFMKKKSFRWNIEMELRELWMIWKVNGEVVLGILVIIPWKGFTCFKKATI